jgi:hypothetical protein
MRNALLEQYESALFALLMDNMAVQEGQAAAEENLRLQADPTYAVPPELKARCLRAIRRSAGKGKAASFRKTAVKVLNRAAVILLICVSLFACVFAVSKDVRTQVIHFIVTSYDGHMDFSAHADSSSSVPTDGAMPGVTFGWIPDGYAQSFSDISPLQNIFEFENKGGNIIYAKLIDSTKGTFSIDTENAEMENLTINGSDALLTHKNGLSKITWNVLNTSIIVSISSYDISDSDLVKMARSIVLDSQS